MPGSEIRVEGLAALRRDLRRVDDAEGLAELREGFRDAANVVVHEAQSRVPTKTGKARSSIRATAGGTRAYVVGGKASVPYYGWLDFGTRNPRSGRSRRVGPWTGTGKGPSKGRFIYKAIDAKERHIVELVERALSRALRRRDL